MTRAKIVIMQPPHGVRRVEPGPGQTSVWDHPRPPSVVPDHRRVRVTAGVPGFDGSGAVLVADTIRSLRVLETSHPPVFYILRADIAPGVLRPAAGSSWCEYKGRASYVDVVGPDGTVLAPAAGWTYPAPSRGYELLAGAVAFYPAAMTSATVDGEAVRPQPGTFYGGWITDDVVGPFKGEPGSAGW